MAHKKLYAFLSRSVKTDPVPVDTLALTQLIDRMTDEQLQDFWTHFYSLNAVSKASLAIPDWKTSRQSSYFQPELSLNAFHPTTRDAMGKQLRSEFQQHVIRYLINHINERREWRRDEKDLPVLVKIHGKIGIVFVSLCWALPVVVLVCFFTPQWVQVTVAALYLFLWWSYLLLAIVRAIIRR